MAYKALYRTYRPQAFSEVIGQDVVTTSLKNAIRNNKISHAYLFSGPRGTGKTSVARILAKALNCKEPIANEPCGVCTSCLEISASISPDVIEIDAASNNGVDEIRELRDKVKFLPSGVKYKIYIIDEVHMLTPNAFNALLKTLEEPPKHVVFILATTEPHKVPTTILSRCQRYDFKSLSIKDIVKSVRLISTEENIKISEEAMISIAESAEGALRDALSILDQAISFANDEVSADDINTITGNIGYNKIIELAEYFESKDVNMALATVNDIINLGKEVNKIIINLLQFYRDILLYKNVDVKLFSKYIYEKESFKRLALGIEESKVLYYIDILSDVQSKIKFSTTPRTYLEIALIKMINVSEDELNFVRRVNELENVLKEIQANGGISTSIDAVDNDKVNMNELKINRVINELSKLELPKLIERVDTLEKKPTNSNVVENSNLNSEINNQIQSLLEDIQLLKMNNNNIQNQLDNLRLEAKPIDSNLNKRIDDLEIQLSNYLDVIKNIKNESYERKSEDIRDDVLRTIDSKFEEIDSIKADLRNLKNNSYIKQDFKSVDTSELDYSVKEIKEKISSLEEKVYKLMSGALQQQPTLVKKPKAKDNVNQIALFGGEVNFVEEISKESSKEKFDFGDLQKEFIEEKKPTEEKPINVEDNSEEIKLVIEEKESTEDVIKPKVVEKFETEDATIITTENSRIMVRKPQEEKSVEPIVNLFESEQKELQTEVKEMAKEEKKPIKQEYVPDEFSSYNAKVVERILNDSRSESAINDKSRIGNLWKVLDRSVSDDQVSVARLLQGGRIVAVGNKEFILVYSNAALCNQVMRMKFKKESLKILYDFLGDAYNYMALPENIWLDKRTEYINQYNIGIRKPTLTPISDPELMVVKENEEYISEKEKAINAVAGIFGEDFIKVEDE